MIDAKQIPKEAIDAATRRCGCGTCRKAAREEIAAALNAWPGAGMSQFHENVVALPLPQKENNND